jgi:IS30 family transposase
MPYHSWERGLNEKTKGLVRKCLPKGTDFAKLTAADLQRVEDLLNNRTRKALNYHSPNEVFAKLTA